MGWRIWIDEELLQRGAGLVGPDALLIYLYLRAGVRRRARDEQERQLLAGGWRFAASSAPEIATGLQLSESTVLRRLRVLTDAGWVRVLRSSSHRVMYVLGQGDEWFVTARMSGPGDRSNEEVTGPGDGGERSRGLVTPVSPTGDTGPRDRSQNQKDEQFQQDSEFPPLKRGSNEEEARKERGEKATRPVRQIRRVEPEKSISSPAVPEPEKSISRLSPQEQRDERSALAKQEAGRNDDLTLDEIVAAWRYLYRQRFGVDDPEMRRKQDRTRAASVYRSFVRAVGEQEWNLVRGYLFDRFIGWARDFEAQKARTPPGWFRILALPDGRPPASWAAYAIRGKMSAG